jgi:ribulose-5-phosphate 4-epimerase/fuculose-1-phosphate aldolase
MPLPNGYTNNDFRTARREVALACRVLAARGLADGILGHVSMRVDDEHVLVRCRSPRERGLRFTEEADVQLVGYDGSGALDDGYTLPHEFWIHAELLRARRDAGAVVHAHPRPVLLAELAGLPLRPVFGAYDIPAQRLAREGVPVFPRSVLIRSPELGRELATTLGELSACILHGHGIATVGASVPEAVVRALTLLELAEVTLELALLGARPEAVPEADAAELPDLGGGFNVDASWRLELGRLGISDT